MLTSPGFFFKEAILSNTFVFFFLHFRKKNNNNKKKNMDQRLFVVYMCIVFVISTTTGVYLKLSRLRDIMIPPDMVGGPRRVETGLYKDCKTSNKHPSLIWSLETE